MIIWEYLGQRLQTQMPKAGSINVWFRPDLRQFGKELKYTHTHIYSHMIIFKHRLAEHNSSIVYL